MNVIQRIFARHGPARGTPGRAVQTLLLVSLAAGAFSSGAARACENDALADFVAAAYGDRIEFDVYRNGKRVGEHTTRFERLGGELRVLSEMNLEIKLLMVPVYSFDYRSDATWCGDRLQQLESRVSDNGKVQQARALAEADVLTVERADASYTVAPDIIPTNHWNPEVLGKDRVLNTISGKVNRVSIAACADGPLAMGGVADGARCYQYQGELDTRVWYDGDGRWVGLEFFGRDGSVVNYVCRRCGVAS